MEIQGKIIAVLPERGGVSQRTGNEWKLAQYVIETIEQYPKKCVFEVFGTERIQQMNIQLGQFLTVSFDIDAHEYQGRWFNGIRAWKVEPYDPNAVLGPAATPIDLPVGGAAPAAPAAPFPTAQTSGSPAAPAPAFGGDSTDDLPF